MREKKVLVGNRELLEKSSEIYEYQKNHPKENLYNICWPLDSEYNQKMEELAEEEPFKSNYEYFLNELLKPFEFVNDYGLTDKAIRKVLENHLDGVIASRKWMNHLCVEMIWNMMLNRIAI